MQWIKRLIAAYRYIAERLKALIAEYGWIALGTYLVIFVLALGSSFALAIRMGFEPASFGSWVATLVAAWVATKATQPLRIIATLAITPMVARLLRRRPVGQGAQVTSLPATPTAK